MLDEVGGQVDHIDAITVDEGHIEVQQGNARCCGDDWNGWPPMNKPGHMEKVLVHGL
jgi:hypothetical protein